MKTIKDLCESCGCDPGESWVSARRYEEINSQLKEAKQAIVDLQNALQIKHDSDYNEGLKEDFHQRLP